MSDSERSNFSDAESVSEAGSRAASPARSDRSRGSVRSAVRSRSRSVSRSRSHSRSRSRSGSAGSRSGSEAREASADERVEDEQEPEGEDLRDSEEYDSEEDSDEGPARKRKKKDRYGGFIIDEAEVDDEPIDASIAIAHFTRATNYRHITDILLQSILTHNAALRRETTLFARFLFHKLQRIQSPVVRRNLETTIYSILSDDISSDEFFDALRVANYLFTDCIGYNTVFGQYSPVFSCYISTRLHYNCISTNTRYDLMEIMTRYVNDFMDREGYN